jgi:hypothetical protein
MLVIPVNRVVDKKRIIRKREVGGGGEAQGVPVIVVCSLLNRQCCESVLLECAFQGCQIFIGRAYKNAENIPNDHKIYQITTKYTKSPQNIPNDQNIYQMTKIYTK